MVGSVVILTESFLGTPNPCFAYIFSEYTIGSGGGYELMALWFEENVTDPTVTWLGGNNAKLVTKDLGGFSHEEMIKYTISYNNYVMGTIRVFDDEESRSNPRRIHHEIQSSLYNISLNNNLLINYMRDYNIGLLQDSK